MKCGCEWKNFSKHKNMTCSTGHIFSLLFTAGFIIIIAFLMIILVIGMTMGRKIKVKIPTSGKQGGIILALSLSVTKG